MTGPARPAPGAAPRPPRRKAVLVGVQYGYSPRTLALGYLKAYAESLPQVRGEWEIVIRDLSVEKPWEEIVEAVRAERPELVGFSCLLWNVEPILKACAELKRAQPSLHVVLGGPEATPRASQLLEEEPSVDSVVRGEGELTFGELLLRLGSGADLGGLAGLAYRGEGGVVLNPERPLIPDLDVLPSPYLTGSVDLEGGPRMVALETSRGCPFDCKFCDWQTKQRIRFFSLDRVLRELSAVASRGSHVFLADADLLIHPKRARTVLGGFLKASRDSCMYFTTYLPNLAKVDWMEEMDSPKLWLAGGVQTTNEEVLKKIDRRFDREGYVRLMGELGRRAPQANVNIQMIYGLSFDDIESYRRSVDWALSIHPSDVELFKALVLPGAGYGKDPEKFGLRFQKRPPYEVLGTSTFPEGMLLEADRLSKALIFLMQFPIVNSALAYLAEAAGEAARPHLAVYERLLERIPGVLPDYQDAIDLGQSVPELDRAMPRNQRLDQGVLRRLVAALLPFCEEVLKAAGKADRWPPLERFLRSKARGLAVEEALERADVFERLPALAPLRDADRPLWLGWEGARDAAGPGARRRGRSVHLLSRVFSHSTKHFMFCTSDPRGLHLDIRAGEALLEPLARFLGEAEPPDAVAIADVYSRLAPAVRKGFLSELRRRAAPGCALVLWDDLEGTTSFERGRDEMIRLARGEAEEAREGLRPERLRRELAEAGWTVRSAPRAGGPEGVQFLIARPSARAAGRPGPRRALRALQIQNE